MDIDQPLSNKCKLIWPRFGYTGARSANSAGQTKISTDEIFEAEADWVRTIFRNYLQHEHDC
jgi:hypothetical protein